LSKKLPEANFFRSRDRREEYPAGGTIRLSMPDTTWNRRNSRIEEPANVVGEPSAEAQALVREMQELDNRVLWMLRAGEISETQRLNAADFLGDARLLVHNGNVAEARKRMDRVVKLLAEWSTSGDQK
jgi:hypothetical protein